MTRTNQLPSAAAHGNSRRVADILRAESSAVPCAVSATVLAVVFRQLLPHHPLLVCRDMGWPGYAAQPPADEHRYLGGEDGLLSLLLLTGLGLKKRCDR